MKKNGMALLCAAALLMTGCGVVMPDMTDEQVDLIGEYAAITLLKYDANSRSRLVDLSLVEEKAEPETPAVQESESVQESVPEESSGVPDTPVIDNRNPGNGGTDSAESVLGLPEGMSVEYTGYEICQSYQGESQYFSLEASEGKQLLVLCFDLKNASGEGQDIDLLSSRSSYRVTVNGSYTRSALTTMLDNDLSTYMGTVAGNGTQKVVLLIEVDAEQADNLETISLQLKNEQKTCTIRLL